MSGVFGRDPRAGPWYKDPKVLAVAMGGLGEGLKSVGQNWNKPGLAAFAGSAGAAISGGNQAEDKYFQKTKEAADEVLKAYAANDRSAVNKALVDLREAQAGAVRDHGTIRSRADDWRNSDLGRLKMADDIAQKQVESLRKSMAGKLDPNKNPNPADVAAAQKEFEAQSKDIYAKAYERYKWTPEQADKIRKQGTPAYGEGGKIDIKATREQAIQPRNAREYNALVPKGGYYIDPGNHKLYQRDSDPPPAADAPGGVLQQVNTQQTDREVA
jgi:hypothetical protein